MYLFMHINKIIKCMHVCCYFHYILGDFSLDLNELNKHRELKEGTLLLKYYPLVLLLDSVTYE